MNTINDGGPAFPFSSVSQNQATGETTVSQGDGGMTLRDYFAAKALQGALARPNSNPIGHSKTASGYAAFAYEAADEMLKARAK